MRPTRRYGLQESEKQMKIEKINDYALPCMKAEHALKEAHICMLNQEYDDALDQCAIAITNISDMMQAIKEANKK